MGYKNVIIFVLVLLSVVLGKAFAAIETQEQPSNENHQLMNNLGSMSSSSKLSEYAMPGKSSRYIRFGRTPNAQRFSRSPSMIRFGRSQPFVRFGRANELNEVNRANGHFDKYAQYARNGMDDYSDENIHIQSRGGGDSGFIRFGRSSNLIPNSVKADTLRAINWRNFLRLGRNTNANIRFAGKRDGSSTSNHHGVPIEMLLEEFAHEQKSPQNTEEDRDDEQSLDEIDNSKQFQSAYSTGNDLEQN